MDNPILPIIAGLVNPPLDNYEALPIVQKVQQQIAKEDANVYLIDTEDLEKLEDNLHYNSTGQLELGKRYGVQLIDLLDKQDFKAR